MKNNKSEDESQRVLSDEELSERHLELGDELAGLAQTFVQARRNGQTDRARGFWEMAKGVMFQRRNLHLDQQALRHRALVDAQQRPARGRRTADSQSAPEPRRNAYKVASNPLAEAAERQRRESIQEQAEQLARQQAIREQPR